MQNRKLADTNGPETATRFHEPLDDEERELMEPATWDWDSAEEAIIEPSGYSITEVRLSYEELSRIERAALAKGMTVNAFLRHAALRCSLRPDPA